MKASEMIAKVDRKHDNSIEPIDKLDVINTIEMNVYTQIVLEPYTVVMDLVKDQALYTLDGFSFEDIEQLMVNDNPYTLGSIFIKEERTYYKQDGKLCLKPIPTAAKVAGLSIIRRWKPDPITEADYEARDLRLPTAFEDAYEYALRSKIAFEQKDAAEANAYSALYNAVIDEFKLWYLKQQPNVAVFRANQRWTK